MEITDLITAIAALISAIAAGVSAIIARRYGKEFSRAKEAQIAALQLHIENLRELTPEQLRDSYKSMKEQLVEYIELLTRELDEKRAEIDDKEQVISGLRKESTNKATVIDSLRADKTKLMERAASLESKIHRLEKMQKRLEFDTNIEPGIPEDKRNPMWG